jgi:hypothetical protein
VDQYARAAMRYARRVIETVVDLTYRGLALGRKIKLTQVRPTTGLLELAAPMPVGTQLAITTDDDLTLDATVVWVNEQVAGSERAAGMVVAPSLAAEGAAAWWRARVTLTDTAQAADRPRTRTVTVRPRSHTQPAPPPDGAATDEIPTVIADLEARVVAAAGLEPRPAPPPTQPVIGELVMQNTGGHAIVDDGRPTMVMAIVESADDEPTAATSPAATGDGVDRAAAEPDDGEPDASPASSEPGRADAGRKRRKRR